MKAKRSKDERLIERAAAKRKADELEDGEGEENSEEKREPNHRRPKAHYIVASPLFVFLLLNWDMLSRIMLHVALHTMILMQEERIKYCFDQLFEARFRASFAF